MNSHVVSLMFSTLRPRSSPVSCLSFRARVKRLAWKRIIGNRGRRSFCLGALQFVSDFKRRAREAERDPVYACNAVKSAKSLLIKLFATRMRENQ
jgi:hypothetical protein